MSKKHTALSDNIGTYAEEDDAFKLLTTLAWRLPISVAISALLDLALACVYLKWLHPWKIILQEVGQKQFTNSNKTHHLRSHKDGVK